MSKHMKKRRLKRMRRQHQQNAGQQQSFDHPLPSFAVTKKKKKQKKRAAWAQQPFDDSLLSDDVVLTKKQKKRAAWLQKSLNESLPEEGATKKKRVSWAQQLETFQTKEFLDDLNNSSASISLATELLSSSPAKSALAAKYRQIKKIAVKTLAALNDDDTDEEILDFLGSDTEPVLSEIINIPAANLNDVNTEKSKQNGDIKKKNNDAKKKQNGDAVVDAKPKQAEIVDTKPIQTGGTAVTQSKQTGNTAVTQPKQITTIIDTKPKQNIIVGVKPERDLYQRLSNYVVSRKTFNNIAANNHLLSKNQKSEQFLRQRLSNYIVSRKTFSNTGSKQLVLTKKSIKAVRKRKDRKIKKKTLL